MSEEFAKLVQVMDQLREKCPWDKEQTHQSLLTYLVEETYELVDAVESQDLSAMREELGDLLLQVVFHARIASESGAFTINDVAAGIAEKLERRHPHVFGEVDAHSAADVERNWDELKRVEKQRSSVVDGIPLSQPALAWTSAVVGRATRAGIDISAGEIAAPTTPTTQSVGQLLLAVVALAQRAGIDAEQALRQAGRSLIDQVKQAEPPR